MWRGGDRFGLSVAAPFVWRCPSNRAVAPSPHPRSSNRTCASNASGSRTRPHAFTHGSSRPRAVSRDEPEMPVQVREWTSPALASPDLILGTQPPAQPRCGVVVECPVCSADGAYLEVVRPAAQRAVQLPHHFRGLLPSGFPVGQVVNLLDHAANALLRRPHAQTGLTGGRRIDPPERVTQEVELPFRYLADSCLLFVDRQLELAHDLTGVPSQRRRHWDRSRW